MYAQVWPIPIFQQFRVDPSSVSAAIHTLETFIKATAAASQSSIGPQF